MSVYKLELVIVERCCVITTLSVDIMLFNVNKLDSVS